MNDQELCKAKVEEEIRLIESFLDSADTIYTSQSEIDDGHRWLGFMRALLGVIEKCSSNGYTTWDRSMVPVSDGKYDPAETEKWELAHGHDIRLKCFPEFGCQLLIDPEDLLTDIKKELGI